MSDNEMVHAIKLILTTIEDAIEANQRMVWFDFEGSTPVAASSAVQRVLYSKGYISFVAFDNAGGERLYIDLSREAAIDESAKAT